MAAQLTLDADEQAHRLIKESDPQGLREWLGPILERVEALSSFPGEHFALAVTLSRQIR